MPKSAKAVLPRRTPHTARRFPAGLEKRGIEVGVLQRVNQVQPNKACAKGSYTVYHITGASCGSAIYLLEVSAESRRSCSVTTLDSR